MTIDKYQPCPCGSGKKIKFCCSADIVSELEKLQRMIDGEQRHGALEHVNHLLEKYPARPSLLSIKALLENKLGDTEHAEETIKTLLQTVPDSPIAYAEQARLMATEGKSLEAVAALQHAIESADGEFPLRVYHVLGEVAMALLEDLHFLGARAHLLLHASLGGEDDPQSAAVLVELNANPRIPLLLKQDNRFAECDHSTPYHEELHEVLHLIGRAQWRRALQKLQVLAEKHGRDGGIHRNIALLRGHLGDDAGAAVAWRRFAALVDVKSPDEAIEAEALAQLLDSKDQAPQIEMLDVDLEVLDLDRLMERLLASRRIRRSPVDPAVFAGQDAPPPKAILSLLDRDMPASAEGLRREDVPSALCDLLIFGRETDRPARVELHAPRTAAEQIKADLAGIVGDALGGTLKEEPAGHTDALEEAMTWNWRLPEGTTRAIATQLVDEQRRHVIFNAWPTIPQRVFDGKSPQQVQGDPKYRVRLLAAILLLELHAQQNLWRIDCNELRVKLGLPPLEKVDPTIVNLDRLPLVRYSRVDAAKLATPELLELVQHATMLRATAATRNLAGELSRRTDLPEGLSKASVYGVLAQAAVDNEEAIGLIEQARQEAIAANQSPARWLLSELPLRLQQGNTERIAQIIDTLRSRHGREPGVMQALMELLQGLGMVQPGRAPAGAQAAAVSAAPPSVAAGGIWTPEGIAAAAAEAAEPATTKSGLWLPGME